MKTIEIRTLDEKPFLKDLEVDLDSTIGSLKKILKKEDESRGNYKHKYRIFHNKCPKSQETNYTECENDIVLKDIIKDDSKKDKFYFVWKLKSNKRRTFRGGKKSTSQKTRKHKTRKQKN